MSFSPAQLERLGATLPKPAVEEPPRAASRYPVGRAARVMVCEVRGYTLRGFYKCGRKLEGIVAELECGGKIVKTARKFKAHALTVARVKRQMKI